MTDGRHGVYGYYAQAVGRGTAVLPEGWEARLAQTPVDTPTRERLKRQVEADSAA